ncbi:hypothetical protein EC973_008890 [Apophysomyces ossiformis]|uniref:Uncharacterized protein n=1 Tax=Apophysomyces ossiformis TaxID=679940 RepID=A0A8H7BV23_9FUNG|nr:hypothetical protein EC973_008890 [Apophysomyces ossiformis]
MQRAFSSSAEELSQELEQLLESFCSHEHQKFCLQQHVATHQQLQRIRQTIQQVRSLIPTVGLTHNANSESLRQSLMRTCLEMLEYYNAFCQQRHIRALSQDTVDQLHIEWQEISHTFEPKAKEQGDFRELLDSLKVLNKAWKKPRHVSRILASMLATYELKAGAYIVSIDRYNHSQLGLKSKAAGSRQIVFECGKLTKEEQMEIIAGMCGRFSSIFAQNARSNLAQIETQIQKGRLTSLADKLQHLQEQVYANMSEIVGGGASCNQDPALHEGHRFTTMISPSLWYPEEAINVQTIPLPSFIPSPWEWPDMLKTRRPFQPMLFGLIARRRNANGSFMKQLKRCFSSASPQPSVMTEKEEEEEIYATLSVDRLSRHLVRAGRQFYEDIATSVELKYSQDATALQELGRDIVKIYGALKMADARCSMQRILAILHDLALLDCQSNVENASSHEAGATSVLTNTT